MVGQKSAGAFYFHSAPNVLVSHLPSATSSGRWVYEPVPWGSNLVIVFPTVSKITLLAWNRDPGTAVS